MFRAGVVLCAAILLSACWPLNLHHVTLLDCGTTPLDADNKCPKIEKVGSDFDILVNPATQNVQVTITRNVDNYPASSYILKNCSVVDADNWECKDEQRSRPDAYIQIEIILKNEMHRGHYSRSILGSPPSFYLSSVSGWRQVAMKHGFLTPQQAQSYE